MCGIVFGCSRRGFLKPDDATCEALKARGPDSLKSHSVEAKYLQTGGIESVCYLTFTSSVLSLRGERIREQPLIDHDTGSCLCWNGEAWKIDDENVVGNDTEQLFKLLLDACAEAAANGGGEDDSLNEVLNALTRVAGPYAFVFYDALSSTIYFGRDRLGRRSLVLQYTGPTPADFTIASFSFGRVAATEVATDALHYIDLRNPNFEVKPIQWRAPSPVINRTLPLDHSILAATPSFSTVSALEKHLFDSLSLRTLDVPTFTAITNSAQTAVNPSRVAVLFSGGLDCTLLARLAHNIIPLDQPIDLLNVAFENPRTLRAAQTAAKSSTNTKEQTSPYEACPDRITARSSFGELATTCPGRTWRFVAIDIPYTETHLHRSKVIKLMSPHNTEMDLSITLALYFASRGQGRAITSNPSSPTPIPYTTTARVLLSGLGADELFGGYTRHATAFARTGYEGLLSELELDFTRIGSRNLGRDDRVMAHWGREIRYPFLDETFVRFALALPVWEKVGFRPTSAAPHADDERNLDPAKMVLRLAAWRLGMRRVAAEKKRAIQFGARTAKMEGGRTRGTDVLVAE